MNEVPSYFIARTITVFTNTQNLFARTVAMIVREEFRPTKLYGVSGLAELSEAHGQFSKKVELNGDIEVTYDIFVKTTHGKRRIPRLDAIKLVAEYLANVASQDAAKKAAEVHAASAPAQ